jgi:hypothetical protein
MMKLSTRRTFLRLASGAVFAPAIVGRAQAAPLTLKFSTSQANDPKYSNGRVYYDFLVKQLAANNLSETVKVDFFPDNQLGQEIDVANSVKLGVIDLMVSGTSIWANLVPTLGLMDLGYLFQNFDQQTRTLEAGAAAKLGQMLLTSAKTRIADWAYDLGPRCVLSKTVVIEPADLSGKKIRTLPNQRISVGLRDGNRDFSVRRALRADDRGIGLSRTQAGSYRADIRDVGDAIGARPVHHRRRTGARLRPHASADRPSTFRCHDQPFPDPWKLAVPPCLHRHPNR